MRGRLMALAAQEVRDRALTLLGLSARLPPEGAAAMREAAGQLLGLSEDLARSAANPGPGPVLREAPVVLGPVLDAAIAATAAQIGPEARRWRVDPALRTVTLMADGRALQGALTALLRRAARQGRAGDTVALRLVLAEEMLAILVEDEGEGVPAPDLGPAGPAPDGTRGLDLGLALARSLAAAHGGELRLEATPGIGARAWLTLPRARLLEAA